MANANSTTHFSVNDVDKINDYLQEIESTSYLLMAMEDEIPYEHVTTVAGNIFLRARDAHTLVQALWDAYRETANKLTAATQFVAMAHKEGVDHG